MIDVLTENAETKPADLGQALSENAGFVEVNVVPDLGDIILTAPAPVTLEVSQSSGTDNLGSSS